MLWPDQIETPPRSADQGGVKSAEAGNLGKQITAHCPTTAQRRAEILLDFARRANSAFHQDYFLAMACKALGVPPDESVDARLHAIRKQWFAFDIAGGAR